MITKKQILCLIAVAIITVIVSVACSSPTDVENMAVTEAGPTPTPEFPEDNTNNKLSIDTNQGLIQFKDLSFKSGAYYSIYDTTKKMYFYADVRVDENSKPYISVMTMEEDGNITEEEGKFYDNANGVGAVYNLEATRYKSNNRNTATVTFTEDGYLRIKFSNYGADITYSLLGNGKHSRTELTGKWKIYENTSRVQTAFTVDGDGNINFLCGGSLYGLGTDFYLYSGKISDTFNYPYTTKLTATYRETTVGGVITFDSPSSATISYSYYYASGIGGSGWDKGTSTFTIREALD